MPTGQGLADLLSGAAGAPVNRPQLNAFVANSQARNGLVSAQTQEAMIRAQQKQEQIDAYDRLPQALQEAFPGMRPSEASLARDFMIGQNNGDPITTLKAIGTMKLGYGSPTEQTSGQQMVQGKEAGPVTAPNNFIMPPGSPLAGPPVQQSPEGAAQTALHNAQAAAGGFNPHTGQQGGPLDPGMVDFGGYMLYKTGKMPAMGMGGGAARAAIISHAAQLSQAEANGQPVANQGYDTAIANGQDFTAGQRALGTFAGGPVGNQVRSINNVTGHLQLMEQLFQGLSNGDMQAVNKIGAQWNKAFGSPVPTNIQTAASFIGPELIKILSTNNSAGTAPERQEFSTTAANLANSPEQTQGAITTLKSMLGRQLTDLALQYHGATNRGDFVRRYVAPDTAQYLEVGPQGPPGSPTPTPTPARGRSGLGSTVPTSTPNLPSYGSEAEALAAGHHIGDRVIIGGVSGTLQ